MKIIVGLGNKGAEYSGTRHNVGFMFVDALAKCKEIAPLEGATFRFEKKFEAEIAEILSNGEKIILVKPMTYMNASGLAVTIILKFYKANPDDLILAVDDVDLPLGTIRVRAEGSSAGHKGLKNIFDLLKTESIVRFRLGVASEDAAMTKMDTADFVLSRFDKRELPTINKAVGQAINYLVEFLGGKEPIQSHSMNIFEKDD